MVVRPKASQTFRWAVWWIFQLTKRPPDTPLQSNVWLIQTLCTHACARNVKLKVPHHVKVHVTVVVLGIWLQNNSKSLSYSSFVCASFLFNTMPVLQIGPFWYHKGANTSPRLVRTSPARCLFCRLRPFLDISCFSHLPKMLKMQQSIISCRYFCKRL